MTSELRTFILQQKKKKKQQNIQVPSRPSQKQWKESNNYNQLKNYTRSRGRRRCRRVARKVPRRKSLQLVGVVSWRAPRVPAGAAIPCPAAQIATVRSSRLSYLRWFSPSPIESSAAATLCLKIAPRPLLPRTADRPGVERTHARTRVRKRGVGGRKRALRLIIKIWHGECTDALHSPAPSEWRTQKFRRENERED